MPICPGILLPSPTCQADQVSDVNPFYYKFTCYRTGDLGFLITPRDAFSDYDWELYDVTGKDPNTIYGDGKLVVACNWSGEFGLTGASSTGSGTFNCAGGGIPRFNIMPNIIAGHNYLLLISHFSNTQAGYDLSFRGGLAVIADTVAPRFQLAESNCNGEIINLKLSKKIKCTSLASDGSDFSISSVGASPISSVSIDCSIKFDTDSIQIKLNQALPPGNYTLTAKQGSDGNTLLDACDIPLPVSDIASFTVVPIVPTPMDSLVTPTCSPNKLRLVFQKPMQCSSVAADGSDFRLIGPYSAGIIGASGGCTGSATGTREIVLTLSQPLQRQGNFTVLLQSGTDGNTLLNECAVETPGGGSIQFSLQDTVNADFSYNIHFGCDEDIVDFVHPGNNNVNQWKWNLDDNFLVTQQNAQARYRVFEQKNIELVVGNGFCSDTSRQTFILDNFLKADFIVADDHCHSEPVAFKSTSVGKITEHSWQFGDGVSGKGDSITHIYGPPQGTTQMPVRHTVTDQYGCMKSIEKKITIYVNCQIDVPNAFTPDGDMRNDLLYPLNAIKAEQLDFKVYNRWGQLIFQTNNWKKGWDGRFNGSLQPTGSYVWILQYTHRDTKQRIQKRGISLLVR